MPIVKITKTEIIEKALGLFHQKGYYATSLQDLAVACGLFKGSFYHYFASKEDLMNEVLLYSLEYFRNRVFSIAQDENLAPIERLEKMLKKHKKLIIKDLQGCLFGNISLETAHENLKFKVILQTFFRELQQAFTQIYESKYQTLYASELALQSIKELEGALILMKVFDNQAIADETCAKIIRNFQ